MDQLELIGRFHDATGIPIALVENGSSVGEWGTFSPSPAAAIVASLDIQGDGAYYTITPDYLLCGYIKAEALQMLIGPVTCYDCTQKMVRSTLSIMREGLARENALMRWFRDMPTCDIRRFKAAVRLLGQWLAVPNADTLAHTPYKRPSSITRIMPSELPFINTKDIDIEQRILMAVETGNLEAMANLLNPLDSMDMDFAFLAENATRSFKNTFIMSTAIVARAAIRGGLDYSVAMTLCDEYLVRIEHYETYQEILEYIRSMFTDFTRRTGQARLLPSDSAVVLRICRYVQGHLHEKIRGEDIAAAMRMNRSYLCRHFHQKTGITLTDYISKSKVEEGKRLLQYTDLPLSEIYMRLGFTTQHYFHAVFKKYVGITPTQYRVQA